RDRFTIFTFKQGTLKNTSQPPPSYSLPKRGREVLLREQSLHPSTSATKIRGSLFKNCLSFFYRYFAVMDLSHSSIPTGWPSYRISPPPVPPSGPRSIIQLLLRMTSKLCSMTITVFPFFTSLLMISRMLDTSDICSPVVGSS